MACNNIELVIGARGWNYDHWQNSFYPDGLPEEWRFSYYSNEFRSVLVPWEYLCEADSLQTQVWLNDTDEGFLFFIEVALHSRWEQIFPLVAPLAPQLGGVYLRAVESHKVASLDTVELERLVSGLAGIAPIIVDPTAFDSRLGAIVAPYHAGCYWRADDTDIEQCRERVAIVETSSVDKHHPKSLKKIIEHCCSLQGPTTIGFFVGGEAPSLDDLRNVTIIWQLMS